jgi:hypothetical protein
VNVLEYILLVDVISELGLAKVRADSQFDIRASRVLAERVAHVPVPHGLLRLDERALLG